MSKYGLNVRYYPPGVMDQDAMFVVEVTEWEAKTPTKQHEVILEQSDFGVDLEVDPSDRQWMRTVLEVASQIVENDMAKRDGGWVSGTCANC